MGEYSRMADNLTRGAKKGTATPRKPEVGTPTTGNARPYRPWPYLVKVQGLRYPIMCKSADKARDEASRYRKMGLPARIYLIQMVDWEDHLF